MVSQGGGSTVIVTSQTPAQTGSKSTNTGAIVGGVVGGLAFLGICAVVGVMICLRGRSRQNGPPAGAATPVTDATALAAVGPSGPTGYANEPKKQLYATPGADLSRPQSMAYPQSMQNTSPPPGGYPTQMQSSATQNTYYHTSPSELSGSSPATQPYYNTPPIPGQQVQGQQALQQQHYQAYQPPPGQYAELAGQPHQISELDTGNMTAPK